MMKAVFRPALHTHPMMPPFVSQPSYALKYVQAAPLAHQSVQAPQGVSYIPAAQPQYVQLVQGQKQGLPAAAGAAQQFVYVQQPQPAQQVRYVQVMQPAAPQPQLQPQQGVQLVYVPQGAAPQAAAAPVQQQVILVPQAQAQAVQQPQAPQNAAPDARATQRGEAAKANSAKQPSSSRAVADDILSSVSEGSSASVTARRNMRFSGGGSEKELALARGRDGKAAKNTVHGNNNAQVRAAKAPKGQKGKHATPPHSQPRSSRGSIGTDATVSGGVAAGDVDEASLHQLVAAATGAKEESAFAAFSAPEEPLSFLAPKGGAQNEGHGMDWGAMGLEMEGQAIYHDLNLLLDE